MSVHMQSKVHARKLPGSTHPAEYRSATSENHSRIVGNEKAVRRYQPSKDAFAPVKYTETQENKSKSETIGLLKRNDIRIQREELLQRKRANRLSFEEKITEVERESKRMIKNKRRSSSQTREGMQKIQSGKGDRWAGVKNTEKVENGKNFTIKPFTIGHRSDKGSTAKLEKTSPLRDDFEVGRKENAFKVKTNKGGVLQNVKSSNKHESAAHSYDLKIVPFKIHPGSLPSVVSTLSEAPKKIKIVRCKIGPRSKVKRPSEDPELDNDFLDYCLSKHYKLRHSHWRNKDKVLKRLRRKYMSLRELFAKEPEIVLERYCKLLNDKSGNIINNDNNETTDKTVNTTLKETELVDPRVISMSRTLQSGHNGKIGVEKTFKKVKDKKSTDPNWVAYKTSVNKVQKQPTKPDWPKLKEKLKLICSKKLEKSKNDNRVEIDSDLVNEPYNMNNDMELCPPGSKTNEKLEVASFRKTVSSPQAEENHKNYENIRANSIESDGHDKLESDLQFDGYSIEICYDGYDNEGVNETTMEDKHDPGYIDEKKDIKCENTLHITSDAIPNLCVKGGVSPQQLDPHSPMSPPILEREIGNFNVPAQIQVDLKSCVNEEFEPNAEDSQSPIDWPLDDIEDSKSTEEGSIDADTECYVEDSQSASGEPIDADIDTSIDDRSSLSEAEECESVSIHDSKSREQLESPWIVIASVCSLNPSVENQDECGLLKPSVENQDECGLLKPLVENQDECCLLKPSVENQDECGIACENEAEDNQETCQTDRNITDIKEDLDSTHTAGNTILKNDHVPEDCFLKNEVFMDHVKQDLTPKTVKAEQAGSFDDITSETELINEASLSLTGIRGSTETDTGSADDFFLEDNNCVDQTEVAVALNEVEQESGSEEINSCTTDKAVGKSSVCDIGNLSEKQKHSEHNVDVNQVLNLIDSQNMETVMDIVKEDCPSSVLRESEHKNDTTDSVPSDEYEKEETDCAGSCTCSDVDMKSPSGDIESLESHEYDTEYCKSVNVVAVSESAGNTDKESLKEDFGSSTNVDVLDRTASYHQGNKLTDHSGEEISRSLTVSSMVHAGEDLTPGYVDTVCESETNDNKRDEFEGGDENVKKTLGNGSDVDKNEINVDTDESESVSFSSLNIPESEQELNTDSLNLDKDTDLQETIFETADEQEDCLRADTVTELPLEGDRGYALGLLTDEQTDVSDADNEAMAQAVDISASLHAIANVSSEQSACEQSSIKVKSTDVSKAKVENKHHRRRKSSIERRGNAEESDDVCKPAHSRRRQRIMKTAETPSSTEERLMCDFPKHNWLFNKYSSISSSGSSSSISSKLSLGKPVMKDRETSNQKPRVDVQETVVPTSPMSPCTPCLEPSSFTCVIGAIDAEDDPIHITSGKAVDQSETFIHIAEDQSETLVHAAEDQSKSFVHVAEYQSETLGHVDEDQSETFMHIAEEPVIKNLSEPVNDQAQLNEEESCETNTVDLNEEKTSIAESESEAPEGKRDAVPVIDCLSPPKPETGSVRQRPTQRVQPQVYRRPHQTDSPCMPVVGPSPGLPPLLQPPLTVHDRQTIDTSSSHCIPCQAALVNSDGEQPCNTSPEALPAKIGDFKATHHKATDVVYIPVQPLIQAEAAGKFEETHSGSFQSGSVIHVKTQPVSSFFPTSRQIMPIVLNPTHVASRYPSDPKRILPSSGTHEQSYDNYRHDSESVSYQDRAAPGVRVNPTLSSSPLAPASLPLSLAPPPPLLIQVHPQTIRTDQPVPSSLSTASSCSVSPISISNTTEKSEKVQTDTNQHQDELPFMTPDQTTMLHFQRSGKSHTSDTVVNSSSLSGRCETDSSFNKVWSGETTDIKQDVDDKKYGRMKEVDGYSNELKVSVCNTSDSTGIGPVSDEFEKAGSTAQKSKIDSEECEEVDDEMKKEMEELEKEIQRREQEQAEMLRKKIELINKMKAKSSRTKSSNQQENEGNICESNTGTALPCGQTTDELNESKGTTVSEEGVCALKEETVALSIQIKDEVETDEKYLVEIGALKRVNAQTVFESERNIVEDEDDEEDSDDENNLVIDLSSYQKDLPDNEVAAVQCFKDENTHENDNLDKQLHHDDKSCLVKQDISENLVPNIDSISAYSTTTENFSVSDTTIKHPEWDDAETLDLSKKGNLSQSIPVTTSCDVKTSDEGRATSASTHSLTMSTSAIDSLAVSDKVQDVAEVGDSLNAQSKLSDTITWSKCYDTSTVITSSMASQSLLALGNNCPQVCKDAADVPQDKTTDSLKKTESAEVVSPDTKEAGVIDQLSDSGSRSTDIILTKVEDACKPCEDSDITGLNSPLSYNQISMVTVQSHTDGISSTAVAPSISSGSSVNVSVASTDSGLPSQAQYPSQDPSFSTALIPTKARTRFIEIVPAHYKPPPKKIPRDAQPQPAHLHHVSMKQVLRKLRKYENSTPWLIKHSSPFQPQKRPCFSSPDDHDIPAAKRLLLQSPEPAHSSRPFGIPGKLIVPLKKTLHKRMQSAELALMSRDTEHQAPMASSVPSSSASSDPALTDQGMPRFEAGNHSGASHSSGQKTPPQAHGSYEISLSTDAGRLPPMMQASDLTKVGDSCVIDLTSDATGPENTQMNNPSVDSEMTIQQELSAAVAKRSRMDYPKEASVELSKDSSPQMRTANSGSINLQMAHQHTQQSDEPGMSAEMPITVDPSSNYPPACSQHPERQEKQRMTASGMPVSAETLRMGRMQGEVPGLEDNPRQNKREADVSSMYSGPENMAMRHKRLRADPRDSQKDLSARGPQVALPPARLSGGGLANQIECLLMQPHPSLRREPMRAQLPEEPNSQMRKAPPSSVMRQPGFPVFDPSQATSEEEQIRLTKMQMVRQHHLRKQQGIPRSKMATLPLMSAHEPIPNRLKEGGAHYDGRPVGDERLLGTSQLNEHGHMLHRSGTNVSGRNYPQHYSGRDMRGIPVDHDQRLSGSRPSPHGPLGRGQDMHGNRIPNHGGPFQQMDQSAPDWNQMTRWAPPPPYGAVSSPNLPESPVNLAVRSTAYVSKTPQNPTDMRLRGCRMPGLGNGGSNISYKDNYYHDSRDSSPMDQSSYPGNRHGASPDFHSSPSVGRFNGPMNHARSPQLGAQSYMPRSPLQRPLMPPPTHQPVPVLSPGCLNREPSPRFRIPASPTSGLPRRIESEPDVHAASTGTDGIPVSQQPVTSPHQPSSPQVPSNTGVPGPYLQLSTLAQHKSQPSPHLPSPNHRSQHLPTPHHHLPSLHHQANQLPSPQYQSQPSQHLPSSQHQSQPLPSPHHHSQPTQHLPSPNYRSQPSQHLPSPQNQSQHSPSLQHQSQPTQHLPSPNHQSQPTQHLPLPNHQSQPTQHLPSPKHQPQPSQNLPSPKHQAHPSQFLPPQNNQSQPSQHFPSPQQPSQHLPSPQQPSHHLLTNQQPSHHLPTPQTPTQHLPPPQQTLQHLPPPHHQSQPSQHLPTPQQPSQHLPTPQQPSQHLPTPQPSQHLPTTQQVSQPSQHLSTTQQLSQPSQHLQTHQHQSQHLPTHQNQSQHLPSHQQHSQLTEHLPTPQHQLQPSKYLPTPHQQSQPSQHLSTLQHQPQTSLHLPTSHQLQSNPAPHLPPSPQFLSQTPHSLLPTSIHTQSKPHPHSLPSQNFSSQPQAQDCPQMLRQSHNTAGNVTNTQPKHPGYTSNQTGKQFRAGTAADVHENGLRRVPALLPQTTTFIEKPSVPRPRGRPRRLHMPGESQMKSLLSAQNMAVHNQGARILPVDRRRLLLPQQMPGPVPHLDRSSAEMAGEVGKSSRSQMPSEEMPHLQQIRGSCMMCGKFSLYLCSSCKKIWYCSPECQLTHWQTHAAECTGGAD